MTVSASAVARSVVANDSVECFGITTDRPRNDRLVRRLGEEKHLVDPRSLPLCGPRFCVMAKCARSLDRRMTAQSFRNRVVAPTWLTFDILDTMGSSLAQRAASTGTTAPKGVLPRRRLPASPGRGGGRESRSPRGRLGIVSALPLEAVGAERLF